MIGTLLNVATITIGGILGTLIGNKLSIKVRETVIAGLGLFTFGYGVMSFLGSSNVLIPLGGLITGALLGEWWHIEDGLTRLGEFAREKTKHWFSSDRNLRFVDGFVTASLLFCIGPMAILGSIQDGLTGNYEMLAIKSIMDGFAAMAFASSLGVGVVFSAIMIFLYQGTISLLAGWISSVLSEAMITEMTAVGGIILVGLAISSLLEIKKIRIGNFLPALVITPAIIWILTLLKINF